MQDADLFLSLAEIAGVFVGFGALISVRNGGRSNAHEVACIRSVVWAALWVVVAALAPVIVSRYGITGHELWLVCSLVALVLWLGLLLGDARTPEAREELAAASRARLIGEMTATLLLAVPMMIALVVVVLGLFPDQEPALYLTAVGLGLFMGALTLLFLVFSQRRPQTASDPAALPATGGSGA
jgi:FtsH-binding integral membrane protein